MTHPIIIALDQSTSATKALAYDANTFNVLARASADHKQHYPEPGWVEHDAAQIWENTRRVLHQVVAQVDRDAIVQLSITNQRETTVAFDRNTGEPIARAIVWQCKRSDPICNELADKGLAKVVREKTGLKLDPYFSGSKIAWWMRNRPDVASKLLSGEAVLGTIDTYLIHRLTDGKVFATDESNASRMLIFNIHSRKWDEELCQIFQAPMKALPEVLDSTAAYGQTTLSGALTKPIPIRGVVGDSQGALFAQRAFNPGDCKVTVGTGSSILVNTGASAALAGEGVMTTIAWTHNKTPTYCFEGIINYSAATIEWLKNQLGLISSAAESETVATSVTDNGGVYLVPAFVGLGAPHWISTARAAIVGMSAHSTRAHIVRAGLEAIAYQIHDALSSMSVSCGVALGSMHSDGGATKNKFLMQFISDITGVALSSSNVPDCSPLGAAMLGWLGSNAAHDIGMYRSLAREQVAYRPSMDPTTRQRYLAGWNRAIEQVKAGA